MTDPDRSQGDDRKPVNVAAAIITAAGNTTSVRSRQRVVQRNGRTAVEQSRTRIERGETTDEQATGADS